MSTSTRRWTAALVATVATLGAVAPALAQTGQRTVAAGTEQTCVMRTVAGPVCFGQQPSTVPDTLGPVKAISAGGKLYGCAIRVDDTVACWGTPSLGQATVPAGLRTVTQISAGNPNACAIKTDGGVACWGSPNTGVNQVPGRVRQAVDVSTYADGACAVQIIGEVVCWGNRAPDLSQVTIGVDVEVGISSACVRDTSGVITCSDTAPGLEPPAEGGVQSFAKFPDGPGGCAVTANDDLDCWGRDGVDRLEPPRQVDKVKSVSIGDAHTCVIGLDDRVFCWGTANTGAAPRPATPLPQYAVRNRFTKFQFDTERDATGNPPGGFYVSDGKLPLGLTLDPSGVLEGKPKKLGRYTFEVTTDNDVFAPARQEMTIAVLSKSPPTPKLTGLSVRPGDTVQQGETATVGFSSNVNGQVQFALVGPDGPVGGRLRTARAEKGTNSVEVGTADAPLGEVTVRLTLVDSYGRASRTRSVVLTITEPAAAGKKKKKKRRPRG